MTYLAVSVPWALVLLVLWALVVGAPADAQQTRDQLAARSTEVAGLRATVATIPTPTYAPHQYYGCSMYMAC